LIQENSCRWQIKWILYLINFSKLRLSVLRYCFFILLFFLRNILFNLVFIIIVYTDTHFRNRFSNHNYLVCFKFSQITYNVLKLIINQFKLLFGFSCRKCKGFLFFWVSYHPNRRTQIRISLNVNIFHIIYKFEFFKNFFIWRFEHWGRKVVIKDYQVSLLVDSYVKIILDNIITAYNPL
jgi:hypothetical protein